ncbi:MAG: glycogen/starch synthase, partial [Lachnospiraceae bacterium]
MKKILFVASEAVPFIKTGGLADVVGSLPKYFNKKEYDVRVMLPKYLCMKEEWKDKLEYSTHFYMDLNWRTQYVGILTLQHEGVTFYFIDNEYYFGGMKPYGEAYADIEKFAFFSKAVLSALPLIDFRPDIVHCHDWQTGLVPVYLDNFRYGGEFYRGIKTVMTIHNLKFQGTWDTKRVRDITGLPEYYFAPDKLEAYKDANFLKGGIVYADKVTTVSSSYAEEIKMPFYGEHLEGLMNARANCLSGIVNGIDYQEYDPSTDQALIQNYSVENFRKEKIKNKIAIQEELGLEKDSHKMMIGMVSRLTDQKGFDLIAYVMDELCQDSVQIVALGTGEEQYENMFRHFAWKYSRRV